MNAEVLASLRASRDSLLKELSEVIVGVAAGE